MSRCFHNDVHARTQARREELARSAKLPKRQQKAALDAIKERAAAARKAAPKPKTKAPKVCTCVWKDEHGKPLPAQHVKRLQEHVVPPDWKNIHLATDPKDRVQVLGTDAAGRQQDKRTVEASSQAAAKKFKRQKALTRAIPGLLAEIDRDLADKRQDETIRDTALLVKLMYHTGFRNGHEKDNKARVPSTGASTLKFRHMKAKDGKLHFDFIAKGGKRYQHTVDDPDLYQHLAPRLQGKGWDPTAEYDHGPDDLIFDSNATAALAYLKHVTGMRDIKAHDLRTHRATTVALETMQRMKKPQTEAEFTVAQKKVAKVVGDFINDTPKQALDSYIDPVVWTRWEV